MSEQEDDQRSEETMKETDESKEADEGDSLSEYGSEAGEVKAD